MRQVRGNTNSRLPIKTAWKARVCRQVQSRFENIVRVVVVVLIYLGFHHHFYCENPLFNFTVGQSVCCITRVVVVVVLAAPPDLRRKHQQGERRYMVEKTVICWKSRKSFCTVVDDDDDMLSVPPEPLWVSPYFYSAAATTTLRCCSYSSTKAAIVATPAVDSLILLESPAQQILQQQPASLHLYEPIAFLNPPFNFAVLENDLYFQFFAYIYNAFHRLSYFDLVSKIWDTWVF